MKATTTITTLPTSRNAFYNNRKRVSPASLTRRKESPLRDSLRRTPVELVADTLRQSSSKANTAEREMHSLLELEYRDDVKSYMFEMEVSRYFCVIVNAWGRGRDADALASPVQDDRVGRPHRPAA